MPLTIRHASNSRTSSIQATGEDNPQLSDASYTRFRFNTSGHPLAYPLQQFEARLGRGTRKRLAEVEPKLLKDAEAHMMWKYDHPRAEDNDDVSVANVASLTDDATVINDTNIFIRIFTPICLVHF